MTCFTMKTNKKLVGSIEGQEHLYKSVWQSIFNRLLSLFSQSPLTPPPIRIRLQRLRGVKIGNNVFIGAGVIIDEAFPELVDIGDDATIITRSIILSHSLYPKHFAKVLVNQISKTKIGKGSYIGASCVVLPGINIGDYSILGAGSIVTNDIPSFTKAVGVPAKVISRYSKKDLLP